MDEGLSLEREIFISYAWGGESESFVDRLDQTFQAQGIRIIRDKRDLGYKGRIKAFMERIGRGKYVIAVIGDKYLKSPNCMFELVQISKNGDFYDRIFPVVLADADIYRPVQRLQYVKHWEQEIKALDEAMKEVSGANLQGFREEIDEYTEIRNTIAEIVSTLKDMNTLTADLHSDADFEALRNAINERMQRDGGFISPQPKPPVIPEKPLVIPTNSHNLAQDQYRQKVRELMNDGEISLRGRKILDHLRGVKNLTPWQAKQLEDLELEPIRTKKRHLESFRQFLIEIIADEYPLGDTANLELTSYQEVLEIDPLDADRIIKTLFTQKEAQIQKQRELEAEQRRQETLKQQEQTRENLWQQVKQQMQGIYQDSAQKYRIDYNSPLWEQLNALPDDLRSERNIDYKPLRDLLKAKKWQEADQETYRIMLRTANQESEEDWLNRESIYNFPCADLRTIDQLWVKYSQGHFGFSVQKQIWLKCGGTLDGEAERKLGDALAWREKGEWKFNMVYNLSTSVLAHLPSGTWMEWVKDPNTSPEVHLPVNHLWGQDMRSKVWVYCAIFFSCAENCNL